jgi:hypothetical protein
MKGTFMLRRRTFHECATELEGISSEFRSAYLGKAGIAPEHRQRTLVSTSKRGIEVLRILALAVRTDQDWSLLAPDKKQIGALKNNVSDPDLEAAIQAFKGPYNGLKGFEPLNLREAMNKIAHMHPTRGSFFVDEEHHDLMLSGSRQGRSWVAVISLIELCQLVKQLPDRELPEDCQ